MKGLAATGIGAVDCTRHDMKHPIAVGDLLKGGTVWFSVSGFAW